MLYWILIIYLVAAYFFPVLGFLAVICMIAPVSVSAFRGRFWCGNYCPRGSFYDKIIDRVSLHRKIPDFLRSVPFRAFMVMFIFAMFGVQMYFAWGDWNAMGRVFWLIILVTTIIGILLGVIFSPRAWCTFCPMGSLSALVAPRAPKKGFKNIAVENSCVMCKRCHKVCPMQIKPYEGKGEESGYLDPDCIKCEKCVYSCPKKSLSMKCNIKD